MTPPPGTPGRSNTRPGATAGREAVRAEGLNFRDHAIRWLGGGRAGGDAQAHLVE
ncbi:hypothetical protein [Cryobacterium sp. MLB-32]|uniref:hypothetical protein n=1 Tax=Cryobacterium sp. MLB-32 TaxID=1529318 RepID=UPI0018CFE9AA|nr:hypothetical protein [Cryobacterium sp. MLB-32]